MDMVKQRVENCMDVSSLELTQPRHITVTTSFYDHTVSVNMAPVLPCKGKQQ